MKKICIFLLSVLVCLNSAYSEEGDQVDPQEEQIQVSFVSDVESVVGFSSSTVNSISSVGSNDISDTTKSFHYDSALRQYIINEPIYAYVQIFSTAAVEVKLQLEPLTSKSSSDVTLNWATSNTIPVYSGTSYVSRTISSEDGIITIFNDGTSNIPRAKSWQIIPVLSTDEINNKAGTETGFAASIVVSLYINS